MSEPPVSVLMSAWNAARYVSEAVESILRQTFRYFEFIIIDDGSTDRTGRILRKLAQADGRIRLVSRPNTGLIGALNESLELARGELIARMDADDIAMPERLDRQTAYLRSNPDCVALGSRVLGIDPFGGVLFTSDHALGHDQIDRQLLDGRGWAIVHPSAMMRRDAVMKVGGYRPQCRHLEDLDLFLRLAEVGRLANVPDVLLQYRQHTESINRTRQEEQIRDVEAIVREAYARRGMQPPANWKFVPRVHPPKETQLRTWAWKALKEGKTAAARRFALEAWQSSPWSVESWRTLLCAMRGH